MRNIKKNFPLGGMIVVSVLLIAGILMMFFIGGIPIYILGGFFTGVGFYCWYGYICNVLIKPKEEVLYLIEKDNDNYIFVDSKGKKFHFNTGKKYEVDKYYTVLKTKDYIGEVVGVSDTVFMVVESKESYWLNCYLPVGNFEGIFLLPVVYVIGLFSLSLVVYQGDFSTIIMFIVVLYLIIYDLVYKKKKKNNEYVEFDDTKLRKSFDIFVNSIKIIMISLICIVLFYLFLNISGMIGKIVMLPFLLCALCLFFQMIAIACGNNKLTAIFGKLYILIFLIYWFGVIGTGIYVSIINEEYIMILFLIPFIVVGLFVAYKTFSSKK